MLLFFLISLSFGYATGVFFLNTSEQITPQGIQESYHGNEDQEDVEVIKFKKSSREIMTIIHTHALSLSLMFLALALIIFFAEMPALLKKFLMVEPFISILTTFGGLWLMWEGVMWMTYIVIISGALMHISFIAIVLISGWQLAFYRR